MEVIFGGIMSETMFSLPLNALFSIIVTVLSNVIVTGCLKSGLVII